jgi:DNA-binding GntR family transcriptional regulator
MNPANAKAVKILFMQVREDLSKRVARGEFPVGSQLPTENELIRHYGVSITTVRKAVQALADEGVLEKRQGMGTFVVAILARRRERRTRRKTPERAKSLRSYRTPAVSPKRATPATGP